MKFSEHKFDRLDEIFAQKSISQLIDDGTKLRYCESKYRIKLQNHIVPISVPFSVYEDEISRTEILQF